MTYDEFVLNGNRIGRTMQIKAEAFETTFRKLQSIFGTVPPSEVNLNQCKTQLDDLVDFVNRVAFLTGIVK